MFAYLLLEDRDPRLLAAVWAKIEELGFDKDMQELKKQVRDYANVLADQVCPCL
jgi:hypothetical protein